MFDTDKTLALSMVCIILLSVFPVAGYLTILVLLSHYIRRNEVGKLFGVMKRDPALLFLLLAFGLSTLFSSQHLASLAGITVFALQVLLFVIIRSHLGDRFQNFRIIRYLLLASLFVSGFGIFQYYFVTHMPPTWLDKNLYNNIPNRAFSTLYNPNVLGSYLIMIISIAVAGFSCSDRKYGRVITSLVLIAACLCMILTFSRGAWLGLAVSILIIFIFSKEKPYILAILAVTILLAIPEFDTVLSRINLDFLSNDSTNVYRRYLWKLALQTFADNPVLGAGLGSFGFFLPSHAKATGYLISHAHNFYLHILAETGLLGFLALFGYMVGAMYIAFKLFRSSSCRQTRFLSLGIMAGCMGLLVHGAVDATLYLPQLSIFIWLLVAVIRNLGDLEFASKPVPANPFLSIKPVLTRIFLNAK